jgi:glycosyltransferase involved in cell wall biosynthesis
MHLALVINSLGIGGAERVLVRLAHIWADRGYKISFITFFQENNFCYQLNTKNNNKIHLINLGESRPSPNTNFFLHVCKIIKRIYVLKKLFKKLQPDLIVSFLVGVNIIVLLANFWLKIPIVVSERIDPSKHIIPMFYKKLRLFTYQLAVAIVVQTKKIAEYFPSSWQEKIFIIPNWVKKPVIKKQLGCKNNQKIRNIISVGRLDQQKDHKTLIKAFAKLSVNYPEITLTIYGEGVLRSFLTQLINTLNLQNRIFLPGIAMEVETVLASSDLFVFPSIYEGFPNALCEAMSCGLPVVASNCSGNVDIVEDGVNGLLFNSTDVESLVSSMQKLLDDPDYSNKLATNAQNIVNKFSELEILKLWDNILATSPSLSRKQESRSLMDTQ